jgi:nucleoside 2-deoxyribosyltransferase
MSSPKVYLASPFFNDKQLAMVKLLEILIENAGYECCSPHRDGTFVQPNDPPEIAQKVFYCNVAEATGATIMVANIDWLLPDNHEVRTVSWPEEVDMEFSRSKKDRVVSGAGAIKIDPSVMGPPTKERNVCMAGVHSPALNVPDSGTVFEMGLAFAANVPLITVSQHDKPLNLMLIHAVVAHCAGSDALASLSMVLGQLKKFGHDRTSIHEFARSSEELTQLRHKGSII